MEERIATINDADEAKTIEDSVSSAGYNSFGDLVPTDPGELAQVAKTEDKSNETAKDTIEDEEKKAEGEKNEKEDVKETEKKSDIEEKMKPFNEHPDWQRMVRQRDEAVKKSDALEARLQELEKKIVTKDEEPDFIDISTLDEDEVKEKIDEMGYKAFYANLLRQANHEIGNNLESKIKSEKEKEELKVYEDAVTTTFNTYADQNEDFISMWESGELTKFINKNPGHNAISAHMALSAEKFKESFEKDKKDAIDEAVKEAVKKERETFKAKGRASVLTGESTADDKKSTTTVPELSDTKKVGGLTAAITSRLISRRKAA